MKLTLKIWRQKNAESKGKLESYELDNLSEDMAFLELLDLLNEKLSVEGKPAIEFDHDCREGICGQCSLVINGKAHGPGAHYTTCQTHLRSFKDGDVLVVEPFRAASCIGCGACVAVCKNSSAALFLSAKVSHLVKLPQGKLERAERVVSMVNVHDQEGFGSCTNTGACATVCPQEIPLVDIARLNYEYNRSKMLLNEK